GGNALSYRGALAAAPRSRRYTMAGAPVLAPKDSRPPCGALQENIGREGFNNYPFGDRPPRSGGGLIMKTKLHTVLNPRSKTRRGTCQRPEAGLNVARSAAFPVRALPQRRTP